MDSELECPCCKTTKYRNPQLILRVNICGHAICEDCIQSRFASGAAKCYECGTALRRQNFQAQLFQDSQVEKERKIAKDITSKFTISQDKFLSLRDYNDYLEKLETVIYNLSHDLDIDETNTLLEELRRSIVDVDKKSHDTVKLQNTLKKTKDEPYYHKSTSYTADGPKIPKFDEKYLKSIRSFSTREIAGGFTASLAINRAMCDAFDGLFIRNSKIESYS